uniref:MYND-type domain-containing protein n=1 Tax=Chromera velia CCMP2878 TaxID=1169474 RepID=A0A0G4GUR8_9ALVE|eukprot:Cvel_23394.t1-p1 / transcript=Cvel_23394.t1 / gene=Cvel_23394 / organism=Chromera_velia_CCMP2878 / gene_product=hypothetical protein / transcript_product=hypothetical protein / location=Cvel_scaffold2405:22492-24246(-) / protein_length=585 / sequence_SO=supercontig / SO=protein_coding / is_pseudo=false
MLRARDKRTIEKGIGLFDSYLNLRIRVAYVAFGTFWWKVWWNVCLRWILTTRSNPSSILRFAHYFSTVLLGFGSFWVLLCFEHLHVGHLCYCIALICLGTSIRNIWHDSVEIKKWSRLELSLVGLYCVFFVRLLIHYFEFRNVEIHEWGCVSSALIGVLMDWTVGSFYFRYFCTCMVWGSVVEPFRHLLAWWKSPADGVQAEIMQADGGQDRDVSSWASFFVWLVQFLAQFLIGHVIGQLLFVSSRRRKATLLFSVCGSAWSLAIVVGKLLDFFLLDWVCWLGVKCVTSVRLVGEGEGMVLDGEGGNESERFEGWGPIPSLKLEGGGLETVFSVVCMARSSLVEWIELGRTHEGRQRLFSYLRYGTLFLARLCTQTATRFVRSLVALVRRVFRTESELNSKRQLVPPAPSPLMSPTHPEKRTIDCKDENRQSLPDENRRLIESPKEPPTSNRVLPNEAARPTEGPPSEPPFVCSPPKRPSTLQTSPSPKNVPKGDRRCAAYGAEDRDLAVVEQDLERSGDVHSNSKTAQRLFKCETCRTGGVRIFYCNKKCQRAHWPLHKKVCLLSLTKGASAETFIPRKPQAGS